MPSRVMTVVFTDIKGFTERTAKSDRESMLKLLSKHNDLLRPIVGKYDGTVVKTIGDAFLLTFASPTNAVLCALMMQESLRNFNKNLPQEEKIEIRIAINTGEVNEVDNDVFGEPVNVASRVEGITEANEIWFTESTYLAMNKQEVPNSLVGEFRLKGVPEALKVYRVIQDSASEAFRRVLANQQEYLAGRDTLDRQKKEAPEGAVGKFLPVGIGVAVILAIVGLLFMQNSRVEALRRKYRIPYEEKRFAEAISQAGEFLKENPKDPEATDLAQKAVADGTAFFEEKGEIGKSRELVDRFREQFPALPIGDQLHYRVLARELEATAKSGDFDSAARNIEERIAKEPKNLELTRIAFGFYNTFTRKMDRTLWYCFALAQADPGRYLGDPEILKNLEYFLKWYPPEDGWDEQRDFLTKNCFDRFKPLLDEALYFPGRENPAKQYSAREVWGLRWNAFKMMQAKGLPVNPFKFNLFCVLYPTEYLSSRALGESIAFLASAIASGPTPEQLKEIPAEIASFPLIDGDSLAQDSPLVTIAAKLLGKPLDGLLRRALVSQEESGRRINAFTILSVAGLSPAEVAAYHATNILTEADKGMYNQYQSAFKASLEFWKDFPPPGFVPPGSIASGTVTSDAFLGPFSDWDGTMKKVDAALEKMAGEVSKALARAREDKDSDLAERLGTSLKRLQAARKLEK